MQKKIYFQNLDAIRFIAALMVCASHGFVWLFAYSNCKSQILGKLWSVLADGYLGVVIFFVLSGFLITYILLEEKELTGHINVKNFYIRRVLRIWPLYFLILPIGFVLIPLLYHVPDMFNAIHYRLPYYLTFLSNFEVIHLFKNDLVQNEHIKVIQAVTWSVSIEEQFYLVWPLLFILVKPRYYIFIFLITIIGSTLFRVYYRNDNLTLQWHTLSVMVDLAFGGLSAYLVIKYRSFKEFFSRIPPGFSLLIYMSGFAVLFFRKEIMYYVPYAEACNSFVLWCLFFSFAILDQNFSRPGFFKLVNIKLITFLGKYSYGIYLLHHVAIALVAFAVKGLNIIDTTFLNYLIIGMLTLILTLVMSYLSYEFYEKRFLNLKKKFSVIVKE